jgi:AcrR family transcriptional regulator
MNDEKEIKERILKRSDEMFRQFGYSKITMEEIASDLGISKKTLYKHFSNRDHILKEIIKENKCQVEYFIEELIKDNKLTFIEKLRRFLSFIAQLTSKLENPMIHDLMKCQPEMWKDIDEFRTKHAYKNLSILIEQGMKDGILRTDINTDVVIISYVAAIHSLINPNTLAKLPISANQAFHDTVKIMFEGVFTESGKRKYKSQLESNNGDLTV